MIQRVLVILIGLMLSSGPVYAEWQALRTTPATGETVYVSIETILRNENLVKMWSLWDYKTTQTLAGTAVLSVTTQTEYDCEGERDRLLAMTLFSGNMGQGQRVISNAYNNQPWKPVPIESEGRFLWAVACIK